MPTIYTYGAVHKLKTWPDYFNAVMNGSKNFEVRENDRGFEVGDYLLLEEWNPDTQTYTGAVCARQITYILEGGQFGVEPGYVVMGIEKY